MDTQWPRYEVFEKERADWPHRNAGSVHAPDGEMALLNARDVFVRRPNCLSLWVVPSDQVFSRTIQELAEDDSWRSAPADAGAAMEKYLVFQKRGQRAGETFVIYTGEVEARSPAGAMSRALETFSHDEVFVWWVCPDRAVTKSEAGDAPSMFDPAHSKAYRQPNFYRVVTQMQQLKTGLAFIGEEDE